MKKTIFSLCLAISAFCLSGCSDFLDREPYGKDATWKTKEDVDQAIYALYHFVSPYWSEEICGRGHMWLECASDNILIGLVGSEMCIRDSPGPASCRGPS